MVASVLLVFLRVFRIQQVSIVSGLQACKWSEKENALLSLESAMHAREGFGTEFDFYNCTLNLRGWRMRLYKPITFKILSHPARLVRQRQRSEKWKRSNWRLWSSQQAKKGSNSSYDTHLQCKLFNSTFNLGFAAQITTIDRPCPGSMKPQSAIHPTSLFQTSLLASTPPHAFRSRNKHPASPMLLPSIPSRSPAAVVPPLKATIQDFGAAIASRFTPRAASIPKEISVLPGAAEPLGPSYVAANATGNPSPGTAGINFALAAPHADSVSLCLYDRNGNAVEEAPMHLDFSKAGVWTAFVPGLPSSGVLYGVRVKGRGGWDTPFRWDASRVLLDPWAPLVVGRGRFGVRDAFESFAPGVGSRFLGTFDFASPAFDWGRDYRRPGLAEEDMVIMELPVRCFTAHESSGLPPAQRGTFAGVAEKIPELLELGVNAVELLPVRERERVCVCTVCTWFHFCIEIVHQSALQIAF
jgi:hypothetical protein